MGKYFLAWIGMIPLAIANGVLRQRWYGQYVDELTAHQISTLTAVILFTAYIWLVMRRWPAAFGVQAVSVGVLWLVLTVAFEFSFGHYVAGHSWRRLLGDYDLSAGRVWSIVLLVIFAAPVLCHRWVK